MSLVFKASTSPSLGGCHSKSRHDRPRIRWATSLLLLLVSLACRGAALSPDSERPAETLMIDTRVPTMVHGKWLMLSQEELEHRELVKRSAASSVSSSAPASVTTTFTIAVSSVATPSTTSAVASSPLPSPLDGSLSSNFSNSGSGTNACPAFINSFLNNPTFKKCYPLSLLLQGSTSFFEAQRSLVRLTQVLDASCSADVKFCTTYFNNLAKNLTDASNCGTDYNLGNSVVVQSYIAMIAYPTLYSATCLKDPDSAAYCFANGVTNLTTPSNFYVYFLPLNVSLPGSSTPTCNWCLQKTMGIYQSAAANRALPIANTYVSAAQQVNTLCGPTFVNTTLPNAIVASGGPSDLTPWPQWLLLTLALSAAMQWLL